MAVINRSGFIYTDEALNAKGEGWILKKYSIDIVVDVKTTV